MKGRAVKHYLALAAPAAAAWLIICLAAWRMLVAVAVPLKT